MSDKNQKEQIEKLNKFKENSLPDNVRKSIDEKQKHLVKPFNK
jgi:hypothetical protein